jgi:hypothetical protein
MITPWPTVSPTPPYCGLTYNDQNRPVRAGSAPHIAISAPTRTGKTRRILAPAAVLHPGPAVCVSSKEDLAELVLTKRCLGVTAVIDLRPQKHSSGPPGCAPWSLTRPVRSPHPGPDMSALHQWWLKYS